jgi:tripartite ATP-independent transporter DctM subunit
MDPLLIGVLAVVLMLVLIYLGMHIGIALTLVSFVCVALLRNTGVAGRMVAAAANDTIREDLFSVVPLFVLLGMLVSVSGVGRDTFDVAETLMRRVRGGLGVATVKANAVFAAITGVSVASATIFAKVATPEMRRHGYTKRFSVGVVAGSSVLGMLIPPSLLLIVYGVLAEESVGKLFIAGILPGLLLAAMFSVMIVGMAYLRPASIFEGGVVATPGPPADLAGLASKALPIVILIVIILGGIYSGYFNPTEAAAVGAAAGLAIALARRTLDPRRLWQVLVSTGHVAVSVLFLIMAASLYSRMLALAGLPAFIADSLAAGGLGAWGFLLLFIVIVLLLGMILDSVSIMLIVLPIAIPIATSFGFDKIWFGIITVIAVEVGLLTPPFGLSVYTVKAALDDPTITVWDVFAGTFPFVVCMLVCLAVIVAVPSLSTVLVR